MYTLYQEFMPTETQEQLLADFDDVMTRPLVTPVYGEAKTWFMDAVSTISKKLVEIDAVRSDALTGENDDGTRTLNSDIHYEIYGHYAPELKKATKFVLVVANNKRSGTIFFQDCPELEGQHTENLFTRNGDALTVAQACNLEFAWEQAQVGQLCSFDFTNQLHAAAPQYTGDKKLIFSASIGLPQSPKNKRTGLFPVLSLT